MYAGLSTGWTYGDQPGLRRPATPPRHHSVPHHLHPSPSRIRRVATTSKAVRVWPVWGTAILTVVSGSRKSRNAQFAIEYRPDDAAASTCQVMHNTAGAPAAPRFVLVPRCTSRKELLMPRLASLDDLLVHELQNIYHAERQILEVLPR